MPTIETPLSRSLLADLKAAALVADVTPEDFARLAINKAIREVEETGCFVVLVRDPAKRSALRARGRSARRATG